MSTAPIKLKSTPGSLDTSRIDLADDPHSSGTFGVLFNDPDGAKGRRLIACWNEHDELVALLREAEGCILDYRLAEDIRALLAKIGGPA